MSIAFLDCNTFPPNYDFAIPEQIQPLLRCYQRTSPEQRLAHLEGVQIAITNKVRFDRPLLEQLPELRCILLTATGYDNVDLEVCRELGIAVNNVKGYSTASVADHCLMLMLNLLRQQRAVEQLQQQQAWQQSASFCWPMANIQDLAGKTLVLLGAGDIGQAVAKRARAFDLEVIFSERPDATEVRQGYIAFEQALAQADILSLHCPLTANTNELINAQRLALLKPRALLINTGRGGLLDEQAVVQALEQGQLAGLGVDVASIEPMPADHPFWRISHLPQVIISPHVAWASSQSLTRLMNEIWRSCQQAMTGDSQGFLLPGKK